MRPRAVDESVGRSAVSESLAVVGASVSGGKYAKSVDLVKPSLVGHAVSRSGVARDALQAGYWEGA
jgi:hypothetical protein